MRLVWIPLIVFAWFLLVPHSGHAGQDSALPVRSERAQRISSKTFEAATKQGRLAASVIEPGYVPSWYTDAWKLVIFDPEESSRFIRCLR